MLLIPQIKEYTAMVNKWIFTVDWTKMIDGNGIDRSRDNEQEKILLDFYGVSKLFGVDDFNELLTYGHCIFLCCDKFYLPYDSQYNKIHSGHVILLIDKKGDEYEVYDDTPYFNGLLDCDTINRASTARYYYFIQSSEKTICKSDELEYLVKYFDEAAINICSQLSILCDVEMAKIHKLKTFGQMLSASSLYYSLPIMMNSVKEQFAVKNTDDLISSILVFIEDWKRLINLAVKGYLKNDGSVWNRIEDQIYHLSILENKARQSAATFKYSVVADLLKN